MASAAGLVYAATVDAPLVINGTLSITGSTGSTTTTIGTAIGSTATSATIFTNGTATATAGSITVDIAGILGVVPVNGNYTLLGGPTGSTLSALASYSLGKVYNPSNFTIGSLEASATALSVAVTAQAPLDSIYYTGGLTKRTVHKPRGRFSKRHDAGPRHDNQQHCGQGIVYRESVLTPSG